MDRITNKDLSAVVARINSLMHAPQETYSDGKPNVGNYHLDFAYGGVTLRRITEGGGSSSVFGCGFVDRRTLYGLMFAYIEGIRDYERAAHVETNH